MAFDINNYPDNCDIWNRYIVLIVIKNIFLKPDWCSIIEYKKKTIKNNCGMPVDDDLDVKLIGKNNFVKITIYYTYK